jgi:hypothetical protein
VTDRDEALRRLNERANGGDPGFRVIDAWHVEAELAALRDEVEILRRSAPESDDSEEGLEIFATGPLDLYELSLARRYEVPLPTSAGEDGMDYARARRDIRDVLIASVYPTGDTPVGDE